MAYDKLYLFDHTIYNININRIHKLYIGSAATCYFYERSFTFSGLISELSSLFRIQILNRSILERYFK